MSRGAVDYPKVVAIYEELEFRSKLKKMAEEGLIQSDSAGCRIPYRWIF